MSLIIYKYVLSFCLFPIRPFPALFIRAQSCRWVVDPTMPAWICPCQLAVILMSLVHLYLLLGGSFIFLLVDRFSLCCSWAVLTDILSSAWSRPTYAQVSALTPQRSGSIMCWHWSLYCYLSLCSDTTIQLCYERVLYKLRCVSRAHVCVGL
jgi:hypothetical protein